MFTFLLFQWIWGCIEATLLYGAYILYARYGMVSLVGFLILSSYVTVTYMVFGEKWSLNFRPLYPDICTILNPRYWRVEHHWRYTETGLKHLFQGTPFKNVISRALGVKIGRKVFDGGTVFTERSLVEVGDYCTLNEFALIQSHSLEDGVFKSDYIKIRNGGTIGPNALVHYGVDLAENTVIDADSFVMKGTASQPDFTWRGNPARQV